MNPRRAAIVAQARDFIRVGRIDDALAAVEPLIKLDPRNPELLSLAARAHNAARDSYKCKLRSFERERVRLATTGMRSLCTHAAAPCDAAAHAARRHAKQLAKSDALRICIGRLC